MRRRVESDSETQKATLATLPDVHRPVSLTRLKRLGNITVNRLGAVGVDIEVEVRPDGRAAIIMPLEWAFLHLANFEAQAVGFNEQLQRATWEAKRREAELRAASEEAARRWEEAQRTAHADYRKLTGRGYLHREALHKMKKDRGEAWTVTMLQDAVQKQGAKLRRQQRAELRARVERKGKHLTHKEIAQQEGMGVNQVKWILGKGRPQKTYSRAERAELRETRELVLALHTKGQSRREIAARLGVESQKVYNVLQNAGIRLRPARREQNTRIWEKAKTMPLKQIAEEESLTVAQVRGRLRTERGKHDGKTDGS